MLKIVVFDSGYGGELFADQLEMELPLAEIIRVIDWRNADQILKSPRSARRAAVNALKPYIGRADLIIFANYLLTATSLKYFRRKYKNQAFVGLKLPCPTKCPDRPTVVLTTRALKYTVNYYNYLFHLNRKVDTICLDDWPALIDDGELTDEAISLAFEKFRLAKQYSPDEVILVCSQFSDVVPNLRKVLGKNVKIHDGFADTITDAGKILKIRGGLGKRKH